MRLPHTPSSSSGHLSPLCYAQRRFGAVRSSSSLSRVCFSIEQIVPASSGPNHRRNESTFDCKIDCRFTKETVIDHMVDASAAMDCMTIVRDVVSYLRKATFSEGELSAVSRCAGFGDVSGCAIRRTRPRVFNPPRISFTSSLPLVLDGFEAWGSRGNASAFTRRSPITRSF